MNNKRKLDDLDQVGSERKRPLLNSFDDKSSDSGKSAEVSTHSGKKVKPIGVAVFEEESEHEKPSTSSHFGRIINENRESSNLNESNIPFTSDHIETYENSRHIIYPELIKLQKVFKRQHIWKDDADELWKVKILRLITKLVGDIEADKISGAAMVNVFNLIKRSALNYFIRSEIVESPLCNLQRDLLVLKRIFNNPPFSLRADDRHFWGVQVVINRLLKHIENVVLGTEHIVYPIEHVDEIYQIVTNAYERWNRIQMEPEIE